MSDNKQVKGESAYLHIEFFKAAAANPTRKIPDIGRDFGVSPSTAHKWMQDFIQAAVYTMDERDYPRKVMARYNSDLPEGTHLYVIKSGIIIWVIMVVPIIVISVI